jgi:hypothetical protein
MVEREQEKSTKVPSRGVIEHAKCSEHSRGGLIIVVIVKASRRGKYREATLPATQI